MLRLSDKTRVPDIKPDKPFAGVSSTNRPNGKVQASQQIKQKEQGFISESFGTTQNTILGGIPQYLDMDPLLTGMTWTTKDSDLVTLYRDMYYFDSIAGSCVDLYSNLPFSDFALGGIKDSRVMDKFLEALERINAYVLFPEISVDYQVTGTYLSTLLYNKKEKRFVDLMAHSIENAEITELPFYSQDPIINMKFPDRVRQCFSSDSKRITALKQRLGPNVVELLSKSELELDPLSTIYIPRRTFSTSSLGTSYFRRILPIYLIEKNLYRGTLIESGRRQRGILHLSVGDGDQWEPTPTDLEFITDLFLNADADPIGSIVATRLGIDINEFRCLSGDTFISTDEGLVKLKSLVDHDPNNDDPFTASVDLRVKGHEGKFIEIDQWHYQGIRQTYKVTTESGTSIVGTAKHKNLVLDADGNLRTKRIEDTVVGDMLCLDNNGRDTADSTLPLDLVPVECRSSIKVPKVPRIMTKELAWVLGIIVSEGYVNNYSVSIGNSDFDILDTYSRRMESLFGVKPTRKLSCPIGRVSEYRNITATKACYSSTVDSRVLADLMQQLGVMTSLEGRARIDEGGPCRAYVIPHTIYESNRECKLAFIAACIDGDGSIVVDKSSNYNMVEIKFNSYSKALLKGLKLMLADLGYHSRFNGKTRLDVNTSVAGRLYNDLLPHLQCERKKHFPYCDTGTEYRFGIPCNQFMPVLLERYVRRGSSHKGGGSWFLNDEGEPVHVPYPFQGLFKHCQAKNAMWLYTGFDNGVYKDHLDLIKRVSPSLYKRMIKLFKLRYRFEPIVSIKKYKKIPVYDLSVKGNEEGNAPLFWANGVITKNSGGDFWRVTEVWDTTLPYKLRALGISENFLSGEASYATLESNLTIFVETLRAYRDMMTRKFFYNKLFPLISLVNGYSVNSKGKVIQSDSMLRGDVEDILGTIQDGNKLLIPTVHWAKQLKPEGDQSYIDMLGLLTEKGVPVPLRAFAAAGGFNMDELLQQQEEDLELNKRVLQYQKSLAELKKEHGPAVDEESLSSGYDPSRAYTEKEQKILKLLSPTVGTQSRSSVQATGGKPSILNRDFGEHSEVYKTSKTGKKQHVFFQARANSKANDMIMKSMNTIAKNKHTPLSHTTMTDIKSNEHERKLLKKRGLT